MTTMLLTFHIIIAAAMVGIILIQKNEGGGLGTGGGTMGGLMSSRGTANLLTRTTAVLATLFFLSTLGLALLFKGSNRSKSILDTPVATTTPIATPDPLSQTPPLPAPQTPLQTQDKSDKAIPLPGKK